jgi:hypothetical protein
MPILTLVFPDALYHSLKEQAASQGISVEAVIIERLTADPPPTISQESVQDRIHMALIASGLLEPVSEELLTTYVLDATAPRREPLHLSGQPLSAIVIEQRGVLE